MIINDSLNVSIIVLNNGDYEFVKEIIEDYKKGKLRNYEFNQKFNIDLKQVMSFGDPKEVTKQFLEKFIPEVNNKLIPRPNHKSYKCFVSKTPSIVLHEDAKSSWNCLMAKLNNPSNVLIYKNK